jgi:hypothetical protein
MAVAPISRSQWAGAATRNAQRGLNAPISRSAWGYAAARNRAGLGSSVVPPSAKVRVPPATNPGVRNTAAGSSPPLPFYDALALQQVAKNQFGVNQRIAGLNQASSQAGTDYLNTMGNLNYALPQQELSALSAANARSGGLAGSANELAQEDIGRNYTAQSGAALQGLQGTWQGNQNQIAGLQAGIPIFNEGASLGAIQRRIGQITKTGTAGMPGTVSGNAGRRITGLLARIGLTPADIGLTTTKAGGGKGAGGGAGKGKGTGKGKGK